jgi:uncharacterized protein YcfL
MALQKDLQNAIDKQVKEEADVRATESPDSGSRYIADQESEIQNKRQQRVSVHYRV